MKVALWGLAIGLCAGLLSGMFGIGGGLLIVPALVFLLGFDLQTAIGTSLATLLAPVGVFAVMNYHFEGKVNWWATLFLAIAFVGGAFGGSKLAITMDEALLRKCLSVFLVVVAVYLWFKPKMG